MAQSTAKQKQLMLILFVVAAIIFVLGIAVIGVLSGAI
jgi:hypothetical protein